MSDRYTHIGRVARRDACLRGGVVRVFASVLLLAALTAPLSTVRAQDAASGLATDVAGYALHQNYTPDDYTPEGYGKKLESQNWSVTQDPRGVIYVANQSGVLTYDGERWRFVPIRQRTPVRTVVTGPDGTVYAGTYNEIGYLAPDSVGSQHYVSLVDHVDPTLRDFGNVWGGVATSSGVYFQARRTLFRWDGTKMHTWTTADSTHFYKVFVVRDTVYVAQENARLKRIVDGRLEPVPGSERFADASATAVLPFGDDELLVGTVTSDLFVSRDGRFEPFETEADPFLKTNELYDAVRLPNGTYAFATLWGGVVTVDVEGRTLRLLDEQAGLVDDDVKSLYVDRQDGLWLACEDGLARADVMQPLSSYDERAGLDAVGLSLAQHQRMLYVGASSGIFRLDRRRSSDGTVRPLFVRIPGLRGQVFHLLSTRGGLLAATDRGVYVVRGDQAQLVGEPRTAFSLHQSRQTPSRVYVGYVDGIGLLEQGGPAPQTAGWTVGPRLEGLDKGIFFMEEDATGTLWASSAHSGLWRIPTPGRLADAGPVYEVASEGETPQHIFRMAFLPDDGLRIITRDGVARPVVDADSIVTLVPDTTLNDVIGGLRRVVNIDVAPDGDLWAFSAFDDIYWLRSRGDDGYDVETPFAPVPDFKVYTSLVREDGRLWVVGEKGVMRHVPRDYPRADAPIATLVRSVTITERDSMLYGGTGGTPETLSASTDEGDPARSGPRLDYSSNSIRFEFAAPGFGGEENIEYRFRLKGFDDEWSTWTREARKEYTNLPPGAYRFHVEARNPRMWTAEEAAYAFVVLPPWYRTVWAYLLYVALGIGVVLALVRWRSAHLQRRADHLEHLVAQRTAEVKEKAQQLRAYNTELQRSNEQLQEAVEEKSKLLGVAAHDLKNPLFGIRALAEVLLERDEVNGKIERKLDLIRQSADDTLRLINDLLASAASSGQATLDYEVIDLAGLAEWVVHSFRPQAERKNQTIRCNVPDGACLVEGDKRKIRESMNNLISNAIKYSEVGAPIDVRVQRSEEEVLFSVVDEGPGLSAEDQQRLFAPFQRLTPEPTGDEGSSGLGLYIVKQIVELHEGDVWVDSSVGKGSTFTIVLPASKATASDPSGANGSGTTRTAPHDDAQPSDGDSVDVSDPARVADEEVA